MDQLLREFGLDPYAGMLCEAGFDTPLKVARMTDADIGGMKMKLIHKKKLTKVLAFLAENPPKPESGDAPAASSSSSRGSTPEKAAVGALKRPPLPPKLDKAAAAAAAATTPSPPKAALAPKPASPTLPFGVVAATAPPSPRAGTLLPPQRPKAAESAFAAPAAAPAAPAANTHRVSRLIAECEEHARAVVATITTKSQELDGAKAQRAAAALRLADLEVALSHAAASDAAAQDKLDTALEAGVVENTAMVEKEAALSSDVAELVDADQDLDDQLGLDADALAAKSDAVSALLQKNEDISEEKAALQLLIEDTKRKLAEKTYRAKVAARQERVCKASHALSGATKYADARYTMTRPKVA